MNSFLAREIIIWLLLTVLIVILPLIVIFRKIFPSLLPAGKKISSSIATGRYGVTTTITTWKKKRKQNRRERQIHSKQHEVEHTPIYENNPLPKEITEPILQVQQTVSFESEIDEDAQDAIEEQVIKDKQETQEAQKKEVDIDTEISTQKLLSDEEDFENQGGKRLKTYSSDIDQQKNQKLIESIKYAALTYKERGKPEKYEKKLIEGLSLEQDNQDFMNMLADHYFSTGNYVKALTLLKKIVTVQTQNHKAIRQIGRIYQAQNKPEAAQLLVEKALEQKPDHPKYLISLVEVHYEKGDKRRSLEIMERLRKIRPTNIDYLLTVATLHEELKEPTFARNYYMKILELEPLNEHAKMGLKQL